jgi:hypothetical protein
LDVEEDKGKKGKKQKTKKGRKKKAFFSMEQDVCASYIGLAYGKDLVETEETEEPAENGFLQAYLDENKLKNDWNQQFQTLLSTDYEDRMQLGRLAKEFADAAEAVCVQIVEELFVPEEQRTIRPIFMGGIAGGVKYLEQGIFIKLSCDWKGLYGGDTFSIKSASKELLAVETYLDLRIQDLHFPLVALVLYRGHALLCQSVLPIASNTLQHGSQNAGKSILNESPALEAKLKITAEKLNLQSHLVVSQNRSHSRLLHTAADMEAHIGFDGRYYLLDCARAFPPTAPR